MAEGQINLKKLRWGTVIKYNIFYALGSLRTPQRLEFLPFRDTYSRFMANCTAPGAKDLVKQLQWELDNLLPKYVIFIFISVTIGVLNLF